MTQEDRERIRGAADRLRQAGTRVTTRAVYDALGRKGSYNAMAAVVADWRAETDYKPEIEHHGLPLALKARFLDVGSELLEHVRAEQAAILDVERANADARRRAYEAETAEAAAMVGQLLERVSDLQAEVAHLRALTGVEVAAGSEAGVPGEATAGHQAGVEADHLWDSIAEEIRAMLKERGPMWASEIFASLPVETRQRFLQIGLPLSVGWLGFHLRRMAGAGDGIRIHNGRFALVVEPEDEAEDPPGRNVEATRFWRLVMMEVVAIVRRSGRPMTAVEIMNDLAPNTLECARRFKEIKPAMLAEKMRVRAARKEDPYFVVLKDGYFDLSKAMKLGRAAA